MAVPSVETPGFSATPRACGRRRRYEALDDLAAHMDVDQFALTTMTEDHTEGVGAFLERRKPRFKGR